MRILGHRNRPFGFALCVALIVSLVAVSTAHGQVALPDADDIAATTEAPTAVAPAAPKPEAPEPAAPKVEAPTDEVPRAEAPEVSPPPAAETPKSGRETIDRETASVAARVADAESGTAPRPTETAERAEGARNRLGVALAATTETVADPTEPEALVRRTVTTPVRETRETVDAVVLASGGDLPGGTGGRLEVAVDETLASLTRKASLVTARGSTAGRHHRTGAIAPQRHAAPAALSPVALESQSNTVVAASTSGGGEPPAAGGPVTGRFDFAALGIAAGGLSAISAGEDLDGPSTPPAAPERAPGPTDIPALGSSAGQGFAFTALLAILTLFAFAARRRGRVFGIPNAWCRARGFPTLLELPG